MKEVVGDIWEFHRQGNWIVIPTNGTVKSNGDAVMGKGIALEAKRRFPDIPRMLGFQLRTMSNPPEPTDVGHNIFTFPTKYDWRQKSSPELIEKSCRLLVKLISVHPWLYKPPIYLPRVGCDNGRLNWKDVKPILEKYLDDRFIVVSREVRQ